MNHVVVAILFDFIIKVSWKHVFEAGDSNLSVWKTTHVRTREVQEEKNRIWRERENEVESGGEILICILFCALLGVCVFVWADSVYNLNSHANSKLRLSFWILVY